MGMLASGISDRAVGKISIDVKAVDEGSNNFYKPGALRAVLDGIPSVIFVVDGSGRVEEFNSAAAEFLAIQREAILRHRTGDLLSCLHSRDVPEGCGSSPFCRTCVIRNSVSEACQGKRVLRRRAKIRIVRGREKVAIHALISASPFRIRNNPYALLVIEDISEAADLQHMLTICYVCKEVRDEKETWSKLEAYFSKHWNVEFSHGLCPKCFEGEMERMRKDLKESPEGLRRFG